MSLRSLLPLIFLSIPTAAEHSPHHSDEHLRLTGAVELAAGQEENGLLLAQELSNGEAYIWYLGHCGWAIKTRSRLLIFDYWEQDGNPGERALANGRINPEEIRDLEVYFFVSHDHGDHFDPVILELAAVLPNVTYVFGWDAGLDADFIYLTDERAVMTFGDMEVTVVNHRFDHIPEVAYLVKTDGLVIYHSGDHASTSEVPNSTFTGNIDFFAEKQAHVDLAFMSTFGSRGGIVVNAGDLYAIEQLQPRVVFPMHHGGTEDLNQRFVDEVASDLRFTDIVAALNLGDRFFYDDGLLQRAH